MKALILVGGFGTRLRPLTFTVPKPLVPFCNSPMVALQIKALAKVGVKEIILAVSYQPEAMRAQMDQLQKDYGVKITFSIETEPLGTAGPINLAKEIINQDNQDGLFFVFNSDVICEFPLDKLISFHKAHGKEGTILLTQVSDPSKYGVVLYENDGKIKDFIEKPQQFISDKINAGLYIFNTEMIKRIPSKPTSIEREIFPKMAKDGQLYSMILDGFWMDIGQPKDYLSGLSLYLNHLRKAEANTLSEGEHIKGNVIIHPSARIGKNCLIGPNVSIEANCVIEDNVRLKNCSILPATIIKSNSYVADSIIGWNNKIGKWSRIDGLSVFGEDVEIKDELFINGVFILPHKSVAATILEKGSIIM